MAKVNRKAESHMHDKSVRLAGGMGAFPAKQDAEALLRRVVLANLLWENVHYEGGSELANAIRELVPQVDPYTVAELAIEARTKQKLRHVPLLLAREMARYPAHRYLVGDLLPDIILRADELSEFMAIYWMDGKQPLAKQVKIGLGKAFANFDEYQFAKYNRKNTIKLRDVMFLVHPKPPRGKEELYKKLANDTLATPDTWEVALSTGQGKTQSWERLISERKLGALAFLRNLRNMEETGVSHKVIEEGFKTINPKWLLPLNYLSAVKYAPRWMSQIEDLMLRSYANAPKLQGRTLFIVDTSGSMHSSISLKSVWNRLDVATAMAIMAKEISEDITIYATAGDDWKRQHKTMLLPNYRGFGLMEALDYNSLVKKIGGGGIFTRQCLEYIREKEQGDFDRIIVFSDSQDCDHPDKRVPAPFGKYNYIMDVSAHRRGINYEGVWTAEVSGWSEHFLTYIMALEGLQTQ